MQRSFAITSMATILWVALACDRAPESPDTGMRREDPAVIFATGLALAEEDRWPEATLRFDLLAQIEPDEPTAPFNAAVTLRHSKDFEAAETRLETARTASDGELNAQVAFERGLLAFERGDIDAEKHAFEEAVQFAPNEPVYPFALAELHRRLPEVDEIERGRLLERAMQLWPDNTRLATEVASWALWQPETVPRALEVLEGLAENLANERLKELVTSGRREFESNPTFRDSPTALRRAANLARSTKRFQTDSAALKHRLSGPLLTARLRASVPPSIESPKISLDRADLLPNLDLEAAETIVDMLLLDDPDVSLTISDREAGISLLTSARILHLDPRATEFCTVAEFKDRPLSILSGDLDNDRRSELIAVFESRVEVWDRGEKAGWCEGIEVSRAADKGLISALLVDFEHDGDLDLLGIGLDGKALLFTNRGDAGLAQPTVAPLPVELRWSAALASDLDGDADLDLVMATTAGLVVLRNDRQGEFLPAGTYNLPGSKTQLLSLDLDSDRNMDVITVGTEGVHILTGKGSCAFSLEQTMWSTDVQLHRPFDPKQLLANDLDLDGDLDLVALGETTASRAVATILLNHRGQLEQTADLDLGHEGTETSGLLCDLDGDRDPDLVTTAGRRLLNYRSSGAETQHWLLLRVNAPIGKVPIDGSGIRLEVVTPGGVQVHELRRPTRIVGTGPYSSAVVRATWPNGISSHLIEPASRQEHLLELPLGFEGSCPYLFAWDGSGFRFVTDVLGLSPLGVLIAPGEYHQVDPDEYVRLPNWAGPRDGVLELRLTEELREVTYLDQAELVVVDTPAGVSAYPGEQWVAPAVRGMSLKLLGELHPPVAATDANGRDTLAVVSTEDSTYLHNHSHHTRYLGAVNEHSLTLTLADGFQRPALVLNGWLRWGSTSTNIARDQDPTSSPVLPYLEVPDGSGWRRLPIAVGLPSGKTKDVIIDLGTEIDPQDPRLRLTTDFEVYWDRVAAAELLPTETTLHDVHRLPPTLAALRFRGFSRWFKEVEDGPGLFDYEAVSPYPWRPDGSGLEIPISWSELEGAYTPFGPLGSALDRADDRLVVFGSGEELALEFDLTTLPPLPDGWRRTYLVHLEGWEKDGDPNVACAETVEPIPYRSMDQYPCPAQEVPGIAVIELPRTRWVHRDRLRRRVTAEAFEPRIPAP